jgi:hypothetical protein
MYLYTTVQVRGHVFVYYGSSERSCICILLLRRAVMYLYTTVEMRGHVFADYWTAHFNSSMQIHDRSL